MNLKEIREIVNLMQENELAEIEIEREGSKLKIRKTSSGVAHVVTQPMVAHSIPAAAQPAEGVEAPQAAPESSSSTSKPISSPMVGTFYRAPSPEAPPFAEIGQVIEVGQVVCIIEAMKLMNEIKSDVRGKIVSITAENAEPVEFGQTLFEIEPV